MVVMLAMVAGAAFATQGLKPNPVGGFGSFSSNDCVAYYSAQLIHNGSAMRYQDRQAEMEAQQVSCNNANQK